jgi:hypothetical protein
LSARFEKGKRGTKKRKPEPTQTSLGFLEMHHTEENSGGGRGGARGEREREREKQISRMTTMTMTRHGRSLHFLCVTVTTGGATKRRVRGRGKHRGKS